MRCKRCRRKLRDPEAVASGYGRKCYIKVFGKRPKAESTKPQQGRAVRIAVSGNEQLPGQLSVYDLEQKESAGPDGQRETLQNG